jgi:hypothetical protein
VVWNSLGVALVPDDHEFEPAPAAPETRVELSSVFRDVREAVAAMPIPTEKGSRAAEKSVISAVSPILEEIHGFRRATSSEIQFNGLWRRPIVDGLWTRTGSTLKSLALEVKRDEDVDAPLGQLAEDLGRFDAAIQVRVGSSGHAHAADLVERSNVAKSRFAARAPARFVPA